MNKANAETKKGTIHFFNPSGIIIPKISDTDYFPDSDFHLMTTPMQQIWGSNFKVKKILQGVIYVGGNSNKQTISFTNSLKSASLDSITIIDDARSKLYFNMDHEAMISTNGNDTDKKGMQLLMGLLKNDHVFAHPVYVRGIENPNFDRAGILFYNSVHNQLRKTKELFHTPHQYVTVFPLSQKIITVENCTNEYPKEKEYNNNIKISLNKLTEDLPIIGQKNFATKRDILKTKMGTLVDRLNITANELGANLINLTFLNMYKGHDYIYANANFHRLARNELKREYNKL